VAYYPTQIPFHHRSAWLDNRDVLGELITGCRKLGMTILVRTDPHATYDDTQAAHPDWIQVDAQGKPRRHWPSPEMWVTCALGPYNFEFMTPVHKEIMSRYHVDGIFLNRWDGSGMCNCEHCRVNFKAASGFDLPRTDDAHDPVRRAYLLWWQQRLMQVLEVWNSELRSINPDSCMVCRAPREVCPGADHADSELSRSAYGEGISVGQSPMLQVCTYGNMVYRALAASPTFPWI
jgi:hypothetical protein